MSLSTERMAIANRAIRQTFEKSSIAWQAIPHWDTGDPGQVLVRNDVIPILRRRRPRPARWRTHSPGQPGWRFSR